MTHCPSRRQALKAGAALFAVPFVTSCSNDASSHGSPSAREEAFIREKMEVYQVPGVGIARIEDGGVSWEQGFGLANIETSTPVTDQTLFQAASLSKPIFAYVVMQLIDREVIGLDDTLSDYARPAVLGDSPWIDEITVRDALQHTSGLPNWRASEENAQIVPAFEPGTASTYSGEAYYWLQLAIEERLGAGLDSIMRTYLFEPSGLEDMSMLWEPDRDAREVYGHIIDDAGDLILDPLQYHREHAPRLAELAQEWDLPLRQWSIRDFDRALPLIRPHTHPRLEAVPDWFWAQQPIARLMKSPSGLRSTVGDFARFVCLMMPHEPAAWELSSHLREFMVTPQFERPDVQNGVLPRGIGWGLETRESGTAFYHWGNNFEAYRSVALGDLSDNSGIVVMVNGSNGQDLIKDIVRELTGRDYIGVSTS